MKTCRSVKYQACGIAAVVRHQNGVPTFPAPCRCGSSAFTALVIGEASDTNTELVEMRKNAERYLKLRNAGWIDDAIMAAHEIDEFNLATLDVAVDALPPLIKSDVAPSSPFPPHIPNEFGHLLTPEAVWAMYIEDGETYMPDASGLCAACVTPLVCMRDTRCSVSGTDGGSNDR